MSDEDDNLSAASVIKQCVAARSYGPFWRAEVLMSDADRRAVRADMDKRARWGRTANPKKTEANNATRARAVAFYFSCRNPSLPHHEIDYRAIERTHAEFPTIRKNRLPGLVLKPPREVRKLIP